MGLTHRISFTYYEDNIELDTIYIVFLSELIFIMQITLGRGSIICNLRVN